MPISLDETLVTLAQAARMLPGRPHISTLWRWYRRGVGGIKLETILVGGRRFTSAEALSRFTSRATAAASGEHSPIRTPRQRELEICRAEQELGLVQNTERTVIVTRTDQPHETPSSADE
jgi:hypothetical protein